MAGQVAHALEVTRHAHGGDDRAQVARDRRLSGEQVDRAGVEVVAAVVDGPVALDDPVGELHVRLEEGLGRLADRGGDEPGQLDEVARDLLELVVEDLAHGVPTELRETFLRMGSIAERIVTEVAAVILSQDVAAAGEIERKSGIRHTSHSRRTSLG